MSWGVEFEEDCEELTLSHRHDAHRDWIYRSGSLSDCRVPRQPRGTARIMLQSVRWRCTAMQFGGPQCNATAILMRDTATARQHYLEPLKLSSPTLELSLHQRFATSP